MASTQLRARLKSFVPVALSKMLRRGYGCGVRAKIWLSVIQEITGVARRDQTILRRSLVHGIGRLGQTPDVWQNPELIENADVQARGVGRFHIRAYTDDLYHVLPSREAAVVSTIRARVNKGGCFVDAGANIGFYSVLAGRIVAPGGHVFAIEMLPDTADQLRSNILANGLSNVTVFEHALSDCDGTFVVADVPDGKFGQASIARTSIDARQITVETRTLDTLLETSGPIDMIKMDLESAEFLALKGATRVLARTRCVIFEQLAGDTRCREFLTECGFDIADLDGSNLLAVASWRSRGA